MKAIDCYKIIERARDLGRTNLLFIFGIIKAASIGLAVSVFLQLFVDLGSEWHFDSIIRQLPSFLQWLVSYLCLLVTFDAAMFATIFLVHIPKKSESFFTFLLVGTEALQFAILSPLLLSENDSSAKIMSVPIKDWWYAIFFCYSIFMLCLVINGKKEMLNSEDEFSPQIKPILSKYLKSFKIAKIALFVSISLCVLVFVALFFVKNNEGLHLIIRTTSSVIFTGLAIIAFILQHKQRGSIENDLNKLKSLKYIGKSRNSLVWGARKQF